MRQALELLATLILLAALWWTAGDTEMESPAPFARDSARDLQEAMQNR